MAARYAEAQSDPELLALRDELALIDARLAELVARVDSGESGALWKRLKRAWRAFQKMQGTKGEPRAMTELGQAILAGATDIDAWRDVFELVDQRVWVAESERRRLVLMQQMITTEQAMTLVAALTNAVGDTSMTGIPPPRSQRFTKVHHERSMPGEVSHGFRIVPVERLAPGRSRVTRRQCVRGIGAP